MKQNVDKSNCIQLFHNSRVAESHHREFSLSHMCNPQVTNRIKFVHAFDSVRADVLRSPAE